MEVKRGGGGGDQFQEDHQLTGRETDRKPRAVESTRL